MEIHRAQPESGFAMIPNETLRDPKLSYLARGILAEILSRPDDWNTNADAISTRARKERGRKGEGRDAVRRAFAELKAAGYLHHVQHRHNGRFVTGTHVFDTAQPKMPDGTPLYLALADALGELSPASPQVTPTTEYQAPVPPAQTHIVPGRTDDGSPGVGTPGVGTPGVGKPGPLTKTEDEDLMTKNDERIKTTRAKKNPSHLTSPVPVEGNSADLETHRKAEIDRLEAWMQESDPATAPRRSRYVIRTEEDWEQMGRDFGRDFGLDPGAIAIIRQIDDELVRGVMDGQDGAGLPPQSEP